MALKLVRPKEEMDKEILVLKELGRGADGVAKLILYNGHKCVLKTSLDPNNHKYILDEALLLHDLAGAGGAPLLLGLTKDCSSMVISYCPGKTLRQLRKENCPEAVRVWLTVFQCTADNLTQIHKAGYVHNDLHPRNIIIDLSEGHGQPNVYIIDYGQTTKPGPTGFGTNSTTDEPNRNWYAPELYYEAITTPAADVYSLGWVMQSVMEYKCEESWPNMLKELVADMMHQHPAQRLSLDEVCQLLGHLVTQYTH